MKLEKSKYSENYEAYVKAFMASYKENYKKWRKKLIADASHYADYCTRGKN
jgi:hypothetical protein